MANAAALLGLRALYFVLRGLLDRLVYLSIGLAVILIFIGIKLVLTFVHEQNTVIPKISTPLSLGVIAGVLIAVTLASWWKVRRDPSVRAHAGTVLEPRRRAKIPRVNPVQQRKTRGSSGSITSRVRATHRGEVAQYRSWCRAPCPG